MEQIHGHEVLRMMIESGKTYTRESLVQEITARFGPGTRFCTCAADNLTALELVEFLDARGKLLRREDGFQTSPDLLCGH